MVRSFASARGFATGRAQRVAGTVGGGGGTPPPDPAPVITSGPNLVSRTSSSLTLIWYVNQFCSSRIEYGLTTSYGSEGPSEPSFNYSTHQETISGLNANTTYHVRVRVTNQAGMETIGSDFTFTTEAAAGPPASGSIYGFANYRGGAGPVTGGTGGTVITVNNATEFVAALRQSGTRIIRFGTAGTYNVASTVGDAKANVTIDGSTCPAPGVTITGGNIQWSGPGNGNVIVNDIRHRGRPEQHSEVEEHNFGGINEASGFLFIRCSFAGSLSETIGFWRGASWVTIAECIFGRASYTHERRALLFGNQLSYVNQGKYTRGLSVYRCIFYENFWRNPAVGYWDTNEGGPQATITIADIANNIIWAHDLVNAHDSNENNRVGGYGTTIYQGATANVLYNYYYTTQPAVHISQAQAYAIGNYSRNGLSVTGNVGSAFAVPAAAVLNVTADARSAAASVLTTAGCRIGGLDSYDQNIVNTITAAGL